MTAPHPYLAIRSRDQWRRVAHFDTALTVSEEGVALAERDAGDPEPGSGVSAQPAFAAFDPYCRLFRLLPERGDVSMWRNPGGSDTPAAVKVFESRPPAEGDFDWVGGAPGVLRDPRGIAVDSACNLFICETGADRIWVYDLIDRRLIRAVPLPAGTRPGDSDADGLEVYVTTRAGLGRVTATTEFRLLEGELAGAVFDRVTVSNGMICVLQHAGTAEARVVPWAYPDRHYAAPFATDIAFAEADRLIVAFGPGDVFEEHIVAEKNGGWSRIKNRYFRAKGYDGRGIVRAPDGRIGYFSDKGFRYALPVKPRFRTRGRIVSFALDSGAYQNRWGLVFVDACVPKGCAMRIRFHASDEQPGDFLLPRSSAINDGEFGPLHATDRSPTMPKDTAFMPYTSEQADFDGAAKLYRRGRDDELVWDEFVADGRLATYETPVAAAPGRFLWVALELRGSGADTPFVRAVRVQKTGHTLLQHLPKLYSRDEKVASFLRRYLAIPEALLSEFDVSGLMRHVLLDPWSCREEWLTWLAGFLGLAFDERFNPDTRRQLIAEAAWLFRFRGTVRGLQRFLQIYANNQLGVDTVVQIVERFRFRGHGAMLEAGETETGTGAVLGVDYRIGSGQAGESQTGPRPETGGDRHAHRFIVLIAANLGSDELDVANHIIAVHRPAHTAFEICTVDAGMRIGRGLYLQINSFVGQSAGFAPIQLDSGTLGRYSVLGLPKTAATASGGRVGIDARMG